MNLPSFHDNCLSWVSKVRKWLNNRGIHLPIFIFLTIFLFSFPTIYTKIFLRIGKPVQINVEIPNEPNMPCGMDQLDLVRIGDEKVYSLMGWAFPTEDETPLGEFIKQVVLIGPNASTYLYDAETMQRNDVTNYFASLNRDLDNSGFKTYISVLSLEAGIYQLGIQYTNGNSEKYFCITNKYIRKTPNTLKLMTVDTIEETITPEKIYIGKPTIIADPMLIEYEMYSGVDQVIPYNLGSEGIYALDGWAFLYNKYQPLEYYTKQIVLLSSESTAYFFDAETTIRKDVTEYYKGLLRDLDHSGFRSYISISSLPVGKYRIGIQYKEPGANKYYYLTDRYIKRTTNSLELQKNN